MQPETLLVLATFTSPETIGTSPQSMLWLLPLAAAVAIVYKAMKLKTFTAASFAKEAIVLFGSIIIFMAITAVVLFVFARMFTE